MMSIFRRKNVPVDGRIDDGFGEKLKKTIESTSKQVVWILVLNGILWVWASYVLAACGKEQIAESLSTTVCTTILGTVISYHLTSTISNISKYNPKFGGSPEEADLIDGCEDNEIEIEYGPDPEQGVAEPTETDTSSEEAVG